MKIIAPGIFVSSKERFPIPIACGLWPKLIADKVVSRNISGIRMEANNITSKSAFDCIPTTNDVAMKINTPPILRNPLVTNAVFAVFTPLAISLVAQ